MLSQGGCSYLGSSPGLLSFKWGLWDSAFYGFFDATLFNIQGTVGRKTIMARAQLLIILLTLEMTHITSVHVPSAGGGEMEFLAGQVPPRSDSKIQKGSPDLQC